MKYFTCTTFKKRIFFLLIIFLSFDSYGQADGTFNDKSKYIKLSWANDALKLRGITDRYFTNGVNLEYYYSPTHPERYEKIFFRMPASTTRNNNFSVAGGMNMYTPTDITRTAIDTTDRPYAGWLYFAIKCISNEFASSQRLTTEYSVGIMGPHAYQKEVQIWYHDLINSRKPMGWDNQISDDVALNIKIDYEWAVVKPNKNIEMVGMIEANVGTVTNFLGLGSTIRIGSFNDYFINEFGLRTDSADFIKYSRNTDNFQSRPTYVENLRRKIQSFVFIRGSIRTVIDNSLLQGGIFNWRDSPYRLNSDQIKRFYFNAEFGINFVYKGLGIIYSQHFRTAEFKNAFDTHWGSVTLIVRVKSNNG